MDVRIGDPLIVEVTITDANGNPTNDYQAGSIEWTSTDPTKVAVTDDDADPHDARAEVKALTEGVPVRIGVTLDGDAGEGIRTVSGEGEDINVVPGPATGVTLKYVIDAA